MDGAVEVVGGGGSHACCECDGGAVGGRSGGTEDGLELLGVLVLDGWVGWWWRVVLWGLLLVVLWRWVALGLLVGDG
jgi:hypothetical protein